MANKEMQQLEQIKELISTAKKLTVQLISLEVDLEANKNCAAGSLVPKSDGDDKQALRTHGYVNWNSTHDILKTKHWKKLSEFTEYCGLVERGDFAIFYINMAIKNAVSEDVRFPEDNVYLNVSSPLVWAETLYIKELRRPTPELVKQFLDTVKNEMHTRSSFEEKYGLKWVEPDSEACAMTAPIHELKPLAPISKPIDEQETGNKDQGTTKVIPVTSSLQEDAEPRTEDSSEEPTTFSEECLNEDDQKALELKKFGSAEESTFRKENLVEDTQKALEPIEVDSAKVPITCSKDSLEEYDQKALKLMEVDSAEKPITFCEAYPNEDDQKTLAVKEVGSAEKPTLSQKNLVEDTQKTLKPNEIDSAKQPITFGENNVDENAQKTLELKEVELAEKPIIFKEQYPNEDDQNTLELKEVGSAEKPPTFRKDNYGKVEQKTLEAKEVYSAEKPTTVSEENTTEDDLKALDPMEEDVAEKPRTFSKENPDEDDEKTLELYENFSVILEKVSNFRYNPLNYWEEVKKLGISSEKKLGIVVNLLFEKAIEEPEFSKDYAVFCRELVTLKVPSDNNSDKSVSFRSLLIGKCQNEFEEKLLSNDPKETDGYEMITDEEIRRTRVVATVRFIGALYKHKMLTSKVMDYCLGKLTEQLEEEKLEYLCELLTIIGKQMESQGSSMPLTCLNKMEELVVYKSNTISNHVKLMVKDVVDLGRSKWVFKSSVDFQLKTMDQIQYETEQRAHLIQRMNASDGEQGGKGTNVSGDNSYMNIMFPQAKSFYYSVDTLQLIANMQEIQNYIKLPPACFNNISENMFSILEKFQADLTARRDMIYTYPFKSASNDRLTLGSVTEQKPLTTSHIRNLKVIIGQYLISPDDEELVAEVEQCYLPQYHTAVIDFILNMTLEKTDKKEIDMLSKSVFHLVATKTIAPENFVSGLQDVLRLAPDLFIDIPMLYDHLGKILAPHIEKHITLAKIFKLCEIIILTKQGHLILKAIIYNLKELRGLEFLKIIWRGSGQQISQWMCEEQVQEWIVENKFEFLEGGSQACARD